MVRKLDIILLVVFVLLLVKVYFDLNQDCSEPYINMAWDQCCLDFNGNSVCDMDDPTTTTTSTSSTTTEATTSTTTSTSTTTTSTTLPAWIVDRLEECDTLDDGLRKYGFLSEVGIALNDSSYCDQIPPEQGSAIECYKQVGIALGNVTVCDQISVRADKEDCLREVGKQVNDPAICDSIRHKADRNECLYDIAVETSDPVLCNNMLIDSDMQLIRDECFMEVGKLLNKSGICDVITHKPSKYDCLTGVAINLGNASVCEGISGKYQHDDCVASIV